MLLNEFIATPFYELEINWEEIEEDLEMVLHNNIKKFYSKSVGKTVKCDIKLDEMFFVPTGNDKFDNWLLNANLNTYQIQVSLNQLPKNIEEFSNEIESNFEEWTGSNDFGDRINIGNIVTNIGVILININNDTGNVEWIDCDYGYFEVYEENPHGILATSIEQFLDNLKRCEIDKSNSSSEMDLDEIIEIVREKIVGAINCIAERNYEKMLNFVKLAEISQMADKNDVDAMKQWGIYMDEQIGVSEEEDERFSKSLVIDKFDENLCEDSFEDIAEDLMEGESSFLSYNLYSNGEYIDHMNMEFDISINSSNEIEVHWSWNV